MSQIVGATGQVTIDVGAGLSVAVASRAQAQIFERVGFPNYPSQDVLLATARDLSVVVVGPFVDETTVIIDAGATEVLYNIGTEPTIPELITSLGEVNALDATGDITPAMIVGGVITSTTALQVLGTLPEGADLDAAFEMPVGATKTWSVVNTGVDDFIVDPAVAGNDLFGDDTIGAGTSASFTTIKTAPATFETYRVS
jgi:hypothetical protein